MNGRKKQVRIHIGEYYASKEPVVIQTTLGSCVAVCLMDPVGKIGGMNHILLPGRADLRHYDDAARYGINAMEMLINRMLHLGSDRRRLTAKVFGGAHLIAAISKENSMGDKNVDFALEFLKMERINVINRSVGGTQSRRIYFHTDTGDVFLKRIDALRHKPTARNEAEALKRMKKRIGEPGEIVLFNT
jgi:chemotaxis protein CheD